MHSITIAPEKGDEGDRCDEGEVEPRVEDPGEAGQDHEGHGEEQADHHAREGAIPGAHDF